MAWTYSAALATARDRVRHAVGDIDSANQLRADETIDALLALYGEPGATAALADGLASQYAQEPTSFGSNGLSISWGDRVKTWSTLASRIRSETAAATGSGATAGVLGGAGEDRGSEYQRETQGTWWTR
jgi:hypothetical protein